MPHITSLKNSFTGQVGYAYIFYTNAVYHAAFWVSVPLDVYFNYPFHLDYLLKLVEEVPHRIHIIFGEKKYQLWRMVRSSVFLAISRSGEEQRISNSRKYSHKLVIFLKGSPGVC